ncbi:MAG: flagellar hook-length control protein FliK [Acidobacteriia bacterium]|nr:flagellar hook-length control protein FliK [Terriglobia bacterium]
MSNPSVSLVAPATPSPTPVGTAPAVADESHADGPGAFQALLSGQMAHEKLPAKSAVDEQPSIATEKRDQSTQEDRAGTLPSVHIVDMVAVPASMPAVPITGVIPTPAAALLAAPAEASGKLQARDNISALCKSPAPVTGATAGAEAPQRSSPGLQAGIVHAPHLQPPAEAQTAQSEATAHLAGATQANDLPFALRNEVHADPVLTLPQASAALLLSSGEAARPASPSLALHTPVGVTGWTTELAGRMTCLVGEKVQSAQLHLNPAHLGPVEVRIHINADQQTSIAFAVTQTDTRNALQDALPRLRELLADSGINVSNCSVSAESFAGGSPQGGGNQRGARGGPSPGGSIDLPTPVTRAVPLNALVDVFA